MPPLASPAPQITIRVKDQTGVVTLFKMYNLTKMSKVFSAYEKIQGVENASFCFLFKGKRISETDTPMMLELDEKDLIDCVLAPVAAAAGAGGGIG